MKRMIDGAKDEGTLCKLLDLLPKGEDNAIHQPALATLMGFSCSKLKVEIKKARRLGNVIVSSRKGYFMPEDNQDIKRFVRSMSKQATSRFGSVTKMRSAVDIVDGQMSMADFLSAGANEQEGGENAEETKTDMVSNVYPT